MSYYFIGNPDPEDPHRWSLNTSVNSTRAILTALHKAGFHVAVVKNSESISPYLDELDVSKRGMSREQVDEICKAADPEAEPAKPHRTRGTARFSRE